MVGDRRRGDSAGDRCADRNRHGVFVKDDATARQLLRRVGDGVEARVEVLDRARACGCGRRVDGVRREWRLLRAADVGRVRTPWGKAAVGDRLRQIWRQTSDRIERR